MDAIKTKSGALISPALFQKSETEFIKAFPNDFKQLMFNGASLKDCDAELKALYAVHGKVKKRVKKEK